MKRRRPITNQGADALAASSVPPLTADANRHAPRPAHPGKAAAAANAAPIAAAAYRAAPSGGVIACPPSSTASAANPAPSAGARAANRRTQPRAVVCATPAASAAGRTPHRPAATAASAPPITPAASSRRTRTNAGSSAWVTRHVPHLRRGTKTRRQLSGTRTQRRYPDQNVIGPEQDGQPGRGNSRSRPAATYASTGSGHGHTMAKGRHRLRSLPATVAKRRRGGITHNTTQTARSWPAPGGQAPRT